MSWLLVFAVLLTVWGVIGILFGDRIADWLSGTRTTDCPIAIFFICMGPFFWLMILFGSFLDFIDSVAYKIRQKFGDRD